MFKKVAITPDLYYRMPTVADLDEALEFYLQCYLRDDGGNPIMKTIQMSREELTKMFRPKLEKILRAEELSFLFYYKEKLSMFFFSWDLHNEALVEPSHPDPLIEFKLKLDKKIIDQVKKVHPKRGQHLYMIAGNVPIPEFPQLTQVAAIELLSHCALNGFEGVGSLTYNPKSVSIMKRNGGTLLVEIPQEDIVFQGKKLFLESEHRVSISYAFTPSKLEDLIKSKPFLNRFRQVHELFVREQKKIVPAVPRL